MDYLVKLSKLIYIIILIIIIYQISIFLFEIIYEQHLDTDCDIMTKCMVFVSIFIISNVFYIYFTKPYLKK